MAVEGSKGTKAARNKRREAAATFLNAVSVTIFVAAFLQPLLAASIRWVESLAAVGFIVVLQTILHYILSRIED